MTSIFKQMEDDHQNFTNGRQHKFWETGRQLHYLANRRQMEDDLNTISTAVRISSQKSSASRKVVSGK
jgi:hypothetical protein